MMDGQPGGHDAENPAARVRARRRAERRLRELSFTRLSPNILTVLALCAGMTAVRFAFVENWEAAVAAIVIAGALDASDGRLARLLGASSKFGAELDSLSDVIAFGVAPAIVLYLWTMNELGSFGWPLCLLHCVCVALRLARFNTVLEAPPEPWAGRFFTGVSSPAGAGLTLVPMMLSFQGGHFGFFQHPLLVGIVMLVVSFLMVSQVPTYSFKSVRVPQRGVLPLLLVIGALVGLMVGAPWATLATLGLAYAATIPFAVRSHRRARLAAAAPVQAEA